MRSFCDMKIIFITYSYVRGNRKMFIIYIYMNLGSILFLCEMVSAALLLQNKMQNYHIQPPIIIYGFFCFSTVHKSDIVLPMETYVPLWNPKLSSFVKWNDYVSASCFLIHSISRYWWIRFDSRFNDFHLYHHAWNHFCCILKKKEHGIAKITILKWNSENFFKKIIELITCM